jgi:hypothetical protein
VSLTAWCWLTVCILAGVGARFSDDWTQWLDIVAAFIALIGWYREEP